MRALGVDVGGTFTDFFAVDSDEREPDGEHETDSGEPCVAIQVSSNCQTRGHSTTGLPLRVPRPRAPRSNPIRVQRSSSS